MNKNVEKSMFLMYIHETIKKNPNWGNEAISAITNGLNEKINDLESKLSIAQMGAISSIGFLQGKQKATKKMVEFNEAILLKSVLGINSLYEKYDKDINRHAECVKDFIIDLYEKLYKNNEDNDENEK